MGTNGERGLLRRFLPVLLAVLLAFGGVRSASPETDPAARAAAVAVDSPSAAASDVDAEAAVAAVVADHTRVLTDQVVASAGDSRAPPALRA